jgi:solute carrier family 25 S-adenosylmethionine transporter 26
VYPLDTLKTRIQSPDYQKLYYDAAKNAINRKELFRGLYQGVGSVILITIPSCKSLDSIVGHNSDIETAGAFFTTYEAAKTLLSTANTTLSRSSSPAVPQPLVHSAASAVAELVSCFIFTPAEVLKQNAQMLRKPAESSASKGSTTIESSGTLQALKHFKRPFQLWRGYTTLAARNLPFTAMQFPMFEHLKASITEHRKKNGSYKGGVIETAAITAVSAGSAGSVAAWITTPVDVVKTWIMLSAAGDNQDSEAKKGAEKSRSKGQIVGELASKKGVSKKSSLVVAHEVLNESGIKGLFRGATLRAAWTALGSGLYLAMYESGRVYLEGGHENPNEST